MNVQRVKRPWERKGKWGVKYAPDPYYQSSTWKALVKSFRLTSTLWDSVTLVRVAQPGPNVVKISNTLCFECYTKDQVIKPGRQTDHIVTRKAGGKDEHSNLQTLCDHHHASKSANEGKVKKGKC
ncbi:MAG TPA: HNH endonuclease signature motif containing protein [Cyclobacteriaceae bacterium]|nr:HNH endonuclease signature motif containing protein [Cyclobacteriaceae bacterium]